MVENFYMSVWKTIQDVNYVHATTGTENLLDLEELQPNRKDDICD